eukprot:c7305_g1_i1.p1 GENE.c7305_g1_i1~~c7305_g1_i1.p1  ORF type:complete len:204 (+),score=40.86 c7305_g1_i1:48-659(+)
MNKIVESSGVLTAGEDLSFFNDLSTEVVGEFCRLSLGFIRKGSDQRIFESAANKLGVDALTVQKGVEALVHVFTQSSRMNLNDQQMLQVLSDVGVVPQHAPTIQQFFSENSAQIRKLLADFETSFTRYKDFQWRLDVQLASRFVHDQTLPQFLLQLRTETKGEIGCHLLQADFATMQEVANELENAMAELKSAHCGRVLKYIK